jgi:lipopolysaccharide assembly outer membrane protein LptD (OstA)
LEILIRNSGNKQHNRRVIFLTKNAFPGFFVLIIFLMISVGVWGQVQESTVKNDARQVIENIANDTLLNQFTDSLPGKPSLADSLQEKPKKFGLDNKVKYTAKDTIRFDIKAQKVYLDGDAQIEYGEISLKAAHIEIDFGKNQAYARGEPDSTGKMYGEPVFAEGDQKFDSEILTYNFDTKKGIIKSVTTKDGDGFLYGERIKRLPNERINIQKGWYTTCDAKHPHFEFRYTKAQVIPNNKIISGPAYMVIEDVPVPLFLPFGLFPNKSGQRSGIIIPTFGEGSADRGFYLQNVGYYWGINDYMDFTVTGDIYTSGSWAIRPTLRYNQKYKFNGNFDFSYARNILGDRDAPDTEIKKDFSIRWTHSQDPKARPNSRFSASVNIVTSQFNEYNLATDQDYLSNTFQSSISYQTNWNNKYFLSLNASHSQNTIDRSMNITLPSFTFNTKQFFPLRREKPVGKLKWYENISLKYSVNADNRISTYDSLLFKPGWEDDFRYGAKHAIPLSTSLKVLKFFTLSPSLNYSEKWYPYSIRKTWTNDTLYTATDTTAGYVRVDTINGFNAAREYSFSAGLSTRLYGMYQFNSGPVMAIRHVITPSVSFSYNPDFGAESWGYYKTYQYDTLGRTKRYSIFEGSLYGGPSDGKSGRVSFSLANNLEMKVRSKNDTITGFKKMVLIDNFSLNTSYDLARDSLNWSPLSISGRTVLFKKLNITYSSSWNPYAVDSSGRTYNKFEWEVNKRLFRMENSTWSFSLNYRLSSSDVAKKKGKEVPAVKADDPALSQYSEQEIRDVLDNPDQYIDWNNAWSISFAYSLRFSNSPLYINYDRNDRRTQVQTVNITADLSVTPKWKVGFSSNYDIEAKKFAYSSVDISRDLHCWEMRFHWVPAGPRKSWNFGINVKASILKDLKYDRKKDFRDAY